MSLLFPMRAKQEANPEFEAAMEHLGAVNEYAVRVKAALSARGFNDEQFADLCPALAIAALILEVK